jgi:hypothetical protein
MLSSECSSIGATIAPIPSSILALEASWNATYTGVISGASAAATSTGSASLAVTSQKGTSTPHATRGSSTHTVNTNTYNGGFTSVISLNGGNIAAPTSNAGNSELTPTSTPKSSSNSGTAIGLDMGVAMMFTIVAFWISVFGLP